MKVKDLIAELQQCDPESPIYSVASVEEMPAGYDGRCFYFNEAGQYVYTRKGNKVTFHRYCLEDFLYDKISYKIRCHEDSFEDVKKLCVVDPDLEEEFFEWVEKEYLKLKEYCLKSEQKEIEKLKIWMEKGWHFYQKEDSKTIRGIEWEIYNELKNPENIIGPTAFALMHSGAFVKKEYKPEWIEWVPK